MIKSPLLRGCDSDSAFNAWSIKSITVMALHYSEIAVPKLELKIADLYSITMMSRSNSEIQQ